MIIKNYALHFIALIACVFLFSGCATTEESTYYAGDIEIQDPFEGTNRAVFAFNNAVDDAFIHPIVLTYREVFPKPARSGVRNFIQNLNSPVHLGNQLLQGDLDGAGNVLVRAIVNTTVGVGGLFDVAGYEGIEYEPEDFGQTLAVWGVGHGPYLVVPILGPASVRDYAGFFVDGFADPLRIYLNNIDKEALYYTKVGVQYIDLRESLIDVLADLEASSVDYYASLRSVYYQRRDALVKDKGGVDDDIQTQLPEYPEYPEYEDF